MKRVFAYLSDAERVPEWLPNVVEADPRTWLLLATGLLQIPDATGTGAVRLSGSRAPEIAGWLPVVRLGG